MKKRLQSILASAGVASRRHAADLIAAGKVSVDGSVVTEKGARVDPLEQKILVNGKALPPEEKKYYFLLNKPQGYICTVTDTHGRRKVTDIFTDVNVRLYSIGRLDKDTTGIIIVTNDGELTHRLSHPSFGVDKEYRVVISGDIKPRDIERLRKGVNIDGKNTAPCEIRKIKSDGKRTILSMTIHEGMKRQIKRMFEIIGHTVKELDRVRYAGLTYGRLKHGEFRELTGQEIKKLKRT